MTTYALNPVPTNDKGPIVAGDPSARGKDRILLGKLAETGPGRDLWLDISGEQVIGVLGKRGTGKSYTLGVLVEGLAAGNGSSELAHHETQRGGLVFDLMDIFWSSQIQLTNGGSEQIQKQHKIMAAGGLQSRKLSIDVWLPSGFENPDIDPPNLRQLTIDPSSLEIDDWGALFDINIYSEPRGMLIADLVHHVGRSGYIDLNGNTVDPAEQFGFDELLACMENAAFVDTNYNDMTVRSVRQRMQSFSQLDLFQGAATPLRDLIKPGRVCVLMLARLPDALKRVLVSVLISRILRERRDASFAQKRIDLQSEQLNIEELAKLNKVISDKIPRTWVLMDEAHVLAGANEGSVARKAIIKYAKEGRNYGLSLAVATQQPSALDSRLMSQVETLIVHQLTAAKDAAVAAENMKSPIPDTIKVNNETRDVQGLLRRLSQGEVVFSSGNAPNLSRLCVGKIRPRVTAHGGYEA